MKKLFTSLVLLFCFTSIGYSQCTQIAFGFGNNTSIPSYNVSGDISVVLNADNTITLNLGTNFTTAFGPDVRAYLVNPGNLTNNQLKSTPIGNLQNIMFGLVSSDGINPNGAKTFTVNIPEGINILSYTKVMFYCLDFNVFWDFGTINAFNETNCSLLSTENIVKAAFSLYPNPIIDTFKISGLSLENQYAYKIYNLQGALVQNQKSIENESLIDISTLSKGLYIIEIAANNSLTHLKFLKE
uniref:DM13 domain-containing protein n=1 Tax=Flavobacterium sp. TaxID=239 RepID=UPI004049BADE